MRDMAAQRQWHTRSGFQNAGQTCRHDVLGHMPRGIGSGAVDLCRVLARERATAMPGHSAVGIDDDFSAGQTGITDWTADCETTARIDQEPRLRIQQIARV